MTTKKKTPSDVRRFERGYGFTKPQWKNECWEGSVDKDPGIRFAQYVQHEDLHASVVCAEGLLRGYEAYPVYTAGMVENCHFEHLKKLTRCYHKDSPMLPIFTKEEYYRQVDGDSLIPLRDISQIVGPLMYCPEGTDSFWFEGVIINPYTDGFYIMRDYAMEWLWDSLCPPKYIRPKTKEKEETGDQ